MLSQKRFIYALRDFAWAVQHKRHSYAEQVHALAKMRAETIGQELGMSEAAAKALQDMQQIIQNEYARYDSEFSVRSYD